MEKVECPKCKEMTEPTVFKSKDMLIAVECNKCGYDMKKEVMEARSD